jgi:hypothetical protein
VRRHLPPPSGRESTKQVETQGVGTFAFHIRPPCRDGPAASFRAMPGRPSVIGRTSASLVKPINSFFLSLAEGRTMAGIEPRTSPVTRRSAAFVFVFSLVPLGVVAPETMGQTASTGTYREDGANLPISARTRFNHAAGNADLRNTAEHELLHAIGFTTGYTLFGNRLVRRSDYLNNPPRPNNRSFFSNGNANTGMLRGELLPAGNNHWDATQTVNGTNQANQIMRPDQVVGQRMSPYEATPLNDAFGWNGRNLAITVNFDASFPNVAALRNHITGARDAAHTLFGSNGTGHAFTWTVLNVPPPPRRGDGQQLRTDAPYKSLVNTEVVYQSGDTTITLSNVAYQFGGASGTHHNGQTDYLAPSTLTANAVVNSPAGTSVGTLSLAGLTGLTFFDSPGDEDLDFDPLSANATQITSMSLAGTFQGDSGSMGVSMFQSSSFATTGEHNVFDGGAGTFGIDSFFDLFTELSLDGGPRIPSQASLYVGYVPEPTSFGLLALALAGFVLYRREDRQPRRGAQCP